VSFIPFQEEVCESLIWIQKIILLKMSATVRASTMDTLKLAKTVGVSRTLRDSVIVCKNALFCALESADVRASVIDCKNVLACELESAVVRASVMLDLN